MPVFLIVFILIALVFTGVRYLFVKAGIYLPASLFRILIGIYFFLFLLSVSTFFLAHYDIYWRGYHSTSIIFIVSAITGLLAVWLHKGKLFRLFMVLVFIQLLIATISVWAMADGYQKILYYDDDKYRLEYGFHGIFAPYQILPNLFVKNGLFEKEYDLTVPYDPNLIDISDVKKITITELPDKKIRVFFINSTDTAKGIINPLIVDVELNK